MPTYQTARPPVLWDDIRAAIPADDRHRSGLIKSTRDKTQPRLARSTAAQRCSNQAGHG